MRSALLASIHCVLLECSWVDEFQVSHVLLSNVVHVIFLVKHFLSSPKLNELLRASKDPLWFQRSEKVKVKSLSHVQLFATPQSHSVVSDSLHPMDCSLPGSSVGGILQVRVLEWVAVSFSRRSSQPRDRT